MSRLETVKRWQERLSRFDRSQMTVAQFCESECVSQPSFYLWKKKLREPLSKALSSPSESAVQFMPLRLNVQPSPHMVEPVARTTIELPGGVRICVEVPTNRQTDQLWGDPT